MDDNTTEEPKLSIIQTRRYFTPADVNRFIGVTYRRIQYWDKTGLMKASHKAYGKYRRYTWRDFLLFYVIRELRGFGISIQMMGKLTPNVRAALNRHSDEDLMDARIIVNMDTHAMVMCRGASIILDRSQTVYKAIVFKSIIDVVHEYDDKESARRLVASAKARQARIECWINKRAAKAAVTTPYTEALKAIGHPVAAGGQS